MICKKSHSSMPGSAVALTVLAITALLTFLLGVVQFLPRDFRSSRTTDQTLQARSAAWSGVELALTSIREAQGQGSRYALSEEYSLDKAKMPVGEVRTGKSISNNTPVVYALSEGQKDPYIELIVWSHEGKSTNLENEKNGIRQSNNDYRESEFEVIESIGVSGPIRYPLTVFVNPEKGTIVKVVYP